MADKQKVFISWSGDVAKAVARVWHTVILETFDNVDPFMSEENIGAGERGLDKIAAELAGSTFGVIVVTQENQHSQWLNYEAGALSKDLGDDTVRVAPSLVDFEKKNDVIGPLSGFQANLLTKEGVQAILTEIAKSVDADEGTIVKRFSRAWDSEYEERFEAAKANAASPEEAARKPEEVLDEILTIVRDLARDNSRVDSNGEWTSQIPIRSTISSRGARSKDAGTRKDQNDQEALYISETAKKFKIDLDSLERLPSGTWLVTVREPVRFTAHELDLFTSAIMHDAGIPVDVYTDRALQASKSRLDRHRSINEITEN